MLIDIKTFNSLSDLFLSVFEKSIHPSYSMKFKTVSIDNLKIIQINQKSKNRIPKNLRKIRTKRRLIDNLEQSNKYREIQTNALRQMNLIRYLAIKENHSELSKKENKKKKKKRKRLNYWKRNQETNQEVYPIFIGSLLVRGTECEILESHG